MATVLIVDDSPTERHLLNDLLSRCASKFSAWSNENCLQKFDAGFPPRHSIFERISCRQKVNSWRGTWLWKWELGVHYCLRPRYEDWHWNKC